MVLRSSGHRSSMGEYARRVKGAIPSRTVSDPVGYSPFRDIFIHEPFKIDLRPDLPLAGEVISYLSHTRV